MSEFERTLRLFSDRGCLEHQPPYGYPERGERLVGILDRLESAGRAPVFAGPHPGREDAIVAIHDPVYVDTFRRAVERGDGLLGSSDNPLTPGTWTAASAAVDAALQAADWVAERAGAEAFAVTRPPGHHAERDLAMGFCYFANAAIAAEHLIREHGLDRVAIFDFDVHHGNGTQHIFEQRADVLYLSIHQWPFYPGTGSAEERGVGPGAGATVNVPLPAGAGDGEYRQAFEETILPAIRDFAPQVLAVSAGFDAWQNDPLGGMRVTEAGFAEWGVLLRDLAAQICEGRVLGVLEGGYDIAALPDLILAYLGA